ncbi:MAG: alkaline phosphatase family protein [Deltaproteobacteria bacterium]|nr:alkaline phosphatase family protein [Deltaproteobacteria bacterium]
MSALYSKAKPPRQRLCVLGLDCLSPELVFNELRDVLPNLNALIACSLSGPIESINPPITIPAWSAMLTGVDPGVLGCYGFRNRADYSYDKRRLASSIDIQVPTLWNYLKDAGAHSRLISIPQTYPPKPILGMMVSDYPSASAPSPVTYPASIENEFRRIAEGELADVANHRHLNLENLKESIHAATRRRFRLARAWAQESDWTLLMLVEMGPDRMHHAFWRQHYSYEEDNPYTSAIRDYYIHLDREIGRLLSILADSDIVLIISDHGAQTNKGGIALNQWLIDHNYLYLNHKPTSPTTWDELSIDWPRTRIWADGGHVGRLYFNVVGREPQGIVQPYDIENLAHEVGTALCALPGPRGEKLDTQVFIPKMIYEQTNNIAPDLIVYFDNLGFRAIGSVGYNNIYPLYNDTGRDAANHALKGVCILRDGKGARAAPNDANLYDILPTLLDRLNLPIPIELHGRILE